MFRHVVVFRWQDSVTDSDVDAIGDALDALPRLISEIVTYRHGRDAGLVDTNFDYVVTADFASVDDYVTYRDHPEHQRFIAEHITGRVVDRAAVQFEFAD
jgi:hypothetical protein